MSLITCILIVILIILIPLFDWFWDQLLDLIAKYVVELMSVLLHSHIDGFSIEFESLHKTFWNEIWFFRFLEICKDALQLVENIVFNWILRIYVNWEMRFKDWLSEIWNHVQLLQERIHVASASKILKPNIAWCLLDSNICIKFIQWNLKPRFLYLAMEFV